MTNGPIASDQLRLFIERIERLEEEKKGIADDIKDVYSEAKSQGFIPKMLREMVKLRKMDADERREFEALLDTYKAALGMLDGTPLGKWAVKRLTPKREEDDQDDSGEPATAEEPAAAPAPEVSVEDARQMGRAAAADGKPVTANPFPARDDRRAAWDEAWCAALGSDGMDIPDALKPTPKPKKAETGETPQ